MKKTLPFFFFIFLHLSLFAQSEKDYTEENFLDIGLEYQRYPAGDMPGLRLEYGFGLVKQHGINLRIGMNIADRNDWGVNENETGSGYGASLGYRYYFKSPNKSLFLGARVDLWQMTIDWSNGCLDDNPNTGCVKGATDITILQPTAELGWQFLLGKENRFVVSPSIAFGWEVNVITEGEEVGQGSILLVGTSISYRF